MKAFTQYLFLAGLLMMGFATYSNEGGIATGEDIVIENQEMRLVIRSDGKAVSLLHKPTGFECLQPGADAPVFSLTQYMPYQDELQLSLPSKITTFSADSVHRAGKNLIVNFEQVNIEATIELNITDAYIGFILTSLDYHVPPFGDHLNTLVDEFTILQLPIRDREFFGEWLNVIWDKDIAINVLASDPYARVDAEKRNGYHLLRAGSVSEIKGMNVGAVLITTGTEDLLNRIDRVEQDFNLPRGVQSRRSKEYQYSYWLVSNITPQNVDEYILYARKAGLRGIAINWNSFAKTMGHFPWRPEYPNGMADLQAVIRKIKDAGMIAGANFWYSKAQKQDLYVSPVPDHRLNLRTIFTLSTDVDKSSTTIAVEENPHQCTMDEGRRILKIGEELIEYTSFTTDPPYQFTGCKRAILDTRSSEYSVGHKFGLLDIDTWPTSWVRFDQRTSIQQEVAMRVANIYNEAGFQFCYFNGADDVQPPFWYHVSSAQLQVYEKLDPVPLFSEGASRSHFSWHMLSRGNAFGGFAPEVVKEATRSFPATEAKFIANDFTSINFGFIRYVLPGSKTTGIQPDMIEYICSRGAAWNSPVSISGNLNQVKSHPLTADNLEVIRRWEEARTNQFFSDQQRSQLQNLDQEHILLINEAGNFELQPYEPITGVAGGSENIKAFVFNRSSKTYVVYWNTSGLGDIALDINHRKVKLYKNLDHSIPLKRKNQKLVIPAAERHFLQVDLPEEDVISAFRNATIVLP